MYLIVCMSHSYINKTPNPFIDNFVIKIKFVMSTKNVFYQLHASCLVTDYEYLLNVDKKYVITFNYIFLSSSAISQCIQCYMC